MRVIAPIAAATLTRSIADFARLDPYFKTGSSNDGPTSISVAGRNNHDLLPLPYDEEALRRSVLDLRGRARAILVVARGFGRYHVTIPLA